MYQLIITFADEFWTVLCLMSPWILFGFIAAGLISLFISPDSIKKHFGKKGIASILKASFWGVPLPLCSCGVIPVAASLRKHGAGKGAVTAFLISTPQTGVDSIFVTYSLLGPLFAIFRPVAAFLAGVLGGIAGDIFGYKRSDDINHTDANSECSCSREELGSDNGHATDPDCDGPCCDKKPDGVMSKVIGIFKYAFVTLLGDIATPLLLGLGIAAVISMAVPEQWFTSALGAGIGAMIAMMLLGIPLYVCATASVPIAAVLISKGVTPGAALVFLMTGPATNAATLMTIGKFLGKRSAVIYLLSIIVSSLVAGLTLDLMLESDSAREFFYTIFPNITAINGHMEGEITLPLWKHICGAVMLLFIGNHYFRMIRQGSSFASHGKEKKQA